MKKYSVSMVRERLSDALDAAQRGATVIIERRGVRYRLTVEPRASKAARRRTPRIKVLDPAVSAGTWSWNWTPDGLGFLGAAAHK